MSALLLAILDGSNVKYVDNKLNSLQQTITQNEKDIFEKFMDNLIKQTVPIIQKPGQKIDKYKRVIEVGRKLIQEKGNAKEIDNLINELSEEEFDTGKKLPKNNPLLEKQLEELSNKLDILEERLKELENKVGNMINRLQNH